MATPIYNAHKLDRFLVFNTLKDHFLQAWRSELADDDSSSKAKNYSYIKDSIELESYFKILPKHLYLNLIYFRSSNHKFPIETGRWNDTNHAERKCKLCNLNTVGDEFHYLLECPHFKDDRETFISPNYYRRPNMIKYKKLLSCTDDQTLKKLGIYVGKLIKSFR